MNLFTKINHIPWKYVIGMNLSLLVLAGTFLSMQPALNSTDNRPKATSPTPTPILKPSLDPSRPPQLLAPDPDWAKPGDAILIKGKNLGQIPFGALSIGVIPVPGDHIVDWQDEFIVFTVPDNSVTASVILKAALPSGQEIVTTSAPLTITKTNQEL